MRRLSVAAVALLGLLGATSPASAAPGTTVSRFLAEDAFAFRNYPFGSLSLPELTDEFGADDVFIRVDPCAVYGGGCAFATGVLNPIAALSWGAIDHLLHSSGGHAFGMSRGVQELVAHKERYSRFDAGVGTPFGLSGPSGPSPELSHWLDSRHAAQGSAELLTAWAVRDHRIRQQVQRIREEFANHRSVLIALQNGDLLTGQGHAVLAYDAVDTPTGTDVYVYDSNRTRGGAPTAGQGIIHLDSGFTKWTFVMAGGDAWSGSGTDGTLYAVPLDTIPDDPSLPGMTERLRAVSTFGSAGGAARTAGVSKGVRYLPVDDSHAPGGSAGWLIAPKGARAISHALKGRKAGRYTETFTSPGFAAGVTNVATRRGVRDVTTGQASGHRVHFASGLRRHLSVRLATRRSGGAIGAATVETTTFKGGAETTSLGRSGTLSYKHVGPSTGFSFTLTTVKRSGIARYVSPPLLISSGDRIIVRAIGGQARLTVVLRDGHRFTRTILGAGRPVGALKVGRLVIRGRRARVGMRIGRVKDRAVLGVVLRLTRRGQVVAVRSAALRQARNGPHTLRFRRSVPKLRRGAYDAVVSVRLLTGGKRPGSVTVKRRQSLRIR